MVRTWRGLLKVVVLSLPVWIAEIGMYYLIALGFDIRGVFDSQFEFIAAIVAFGAGREFGRRHAINGGKFGGVRSVRRSCFDGSGSIRGGRIGVCVDSSRGALGAGDGRRGVAANRR